MKRQKASLDGWNRKVKGVRMTKHENRAGRIEDLALRAIEPAPRRLSLEQKIRRLVRRYRAAEKRRLKRQGPPAPSSPAPGCPRERRRLGGDNAPETFEKAARICFADPPVWNAGAAVAPLAPAW